MVKEEYFQKLWLDKFSWFAKVVLSLLTSWLLWREMVGCILFSRCRTALPLAIVVVESSAKLEAIWEVHFGIRICSTDEKHDSWFHDTAVYSFAQLADDFADGAYILGSTHVSKSKTTDWLMPFPDELYFRAYFRTWRHCSWGLLIESLYHRISGTCVRMQRSTRMKRELDILSREPPPGISCWMIDDQIDKLQAGFFYFLYLRFLLPSKPAGATCLPSE